jgi:hypothetical protein
MAPPTTKQDVDDKIGQKVDGDVEAKTKDKYEKQP